MNRFPEKFGKSLDPLMVCRDFIAVHARRAVLAFFSILISVHSAGAESDLLDPVYNGKPLSVWYVGDTNVDVGLLSTPPGLDADASEAIDQLGPRALPFLLRRMPEYRAVDGFRVLGAEGRSAIPALARMATNYAASDRLSRIQNLCSALVGIGPDSLGVLSTIATNEVFGHARLDAVYSIGSLGTNARPAVPVLLQCLKEPNEELLNAAFLALRRVRPNQPKDFQTIADFLDNPKPRVRSDALEALASFGEKVSEPAVIALRDQDVGVRYNALGVLIQHAPHSLTNSAVLAIGADGLKKSIGNRQKWAAQLLRAAGQQSQGVRPDLTVSWPGEWSAVLQEATNALLRLAPQLVEAPFAPELREVPAM